MNLYQLAKLILTIETGGLSKVRFAKTVYFVHKELIRCGVLKPADLTYIRMPLGPVPEGFMELRENHSDIITVAQPTGLSYDASVYKLAKRPILRWRKDEGYRAVESILETLQEFSTSKLVEISHEEPSWKRLKNGEKFTISPKDMEKNLPRMTTLGGLRNDGRENQSLQASLVSGMLKDIVDESTALEFPDNGRQ